MPRRHSPPPIAQVPAWPLRVPLSRSQAQGHTPGGQLASDGARAAAPAAAEPRGAGGEWGGGGGGIGEVSTSILFVFNL